MAIKYGVRLTDLVPQMVLAYAIVKDVFNRFMPFYKVIITSGNDGRHSIKSLHYYGRALDFRTKDYIGNKFRLFEEVKIALGDNYDVVLEDVGTDNEHLHVEYDPKDIIQEIHA